MGTAILSNYSEIEDLAKTCSIKKIFVNNSKNLIIQKHFKYCIQKNIKYVRHVRKTACLSLSLRNRLLPVPLKSLNDPPQLKISSLSSRISTVSILTTVKSNKQEEGWGKSTNLS